MNKETYIRGQLVCLLYYCIDVLLLHRVYFKRSQTPTASQSIFLELLKLPPTMIVAPVAVLL